MFKLTAIAAFAALMLLDACAGPPSQPVSDAMKNAPAATMPVAAASHGTYSFNDPTRSNVIDWVGAEVAPMVDQPVIVVRLKAPPGSDGIEVRKARLTLDDGPAIEVPVPATRVEAAPDASYGPPAELKLPVPPVPSDHLVVASVKLLDAQGHVVMDTNFQDLVITVLLHRMPGPVPSP